MNRFLTLALFVITTNILFAQQKSNFPTIDIPYKKFVLDNGLTLIVSEDHKTPMANFNIWYHVGSKNEKPGKTGFAHLYEHIMFTGSEHYADFDKVMQTIGGGSNNGSTNSDRTHFYESFTPSGLERVLWVESDRMGFLLKGLDSNKIEVQRGVVQNEKRQLENRPYAIADELVLKNSYPTNHPYSWTVIGSMDDLSAASVADIKEWFHQYYGPNNAIISICGDVNTNEVFEKVKKYFGEIPAGPPIKKHSEWIAKMTGKHTVTAQDRVAQPRLQKNWNVPAWGKKDAVYLDLLNTILTNGASSRLYKRLVTKEQLCSEVWSYTNGQEIGQQFVITAMVNDEKNTDKVNQIIDEELNKINTLGVTENELQLAKTYYFSSFVKQLERIGANGKSEILAMNETYGGSPDYYKTINELTKNATVNDIKNVAKNWLTDGEFILKILPYQNFTNTATNLDRTKMPEVGKVKEMQFSPIKNFKLGNGVNVYLIERHEAPIINMSVIFDAGYEADELSKAGTTNLMTDLLLKGTTTKTAEQINDKISELGADLYAGSTGEQTGIVLKSLKNNFSESVNLFSDVLINASFPQSEFDRLKKDQLTAIEQEKTNPNRLAARILPQLIFGKNNNLGLPSSGNGYKETVANITREDIVKNFSKYLGYKNASLFIVGDINEANAKAILEKKLINWKSGDIANKQIAKPENINQNKVYFVDMPDAIQSVIRVSKLNEMEKTEQETEAKKLMNTMFGGSFLSRLNMNLREDKHWSYGAVSVMSKTKNANQFTIYTSVQTDKTKESLIEIMKELTDINSSKPISEGEFTKEQSATLMEIPNRFESNGDLCDNLEEVVFYNKGINYLNTISKNIEQLTLIDIQNAAKKYIINSNLVWLIIGDKKKVLQGIKDLNIGNVEELDKDGNKIN